MVSSLSEQQAEVIPEINTEIKVEVEDEVGKIEAISVNPTEVVNETNIPTSVTEEHTEPTEDVKKKP